MLGFFPVKSVGSRDKIGGGKKMWLKCVMQQKEKLERVLNIDNDKIVKLSKLSHVCLYLFLKDSLFPKLQEYNQFYICDNVPSPKIFLC